MVIALETLVAMDSILPSHLNMQLQRPERGDEKDDRHTADVGDQDEVQTAAGAIAFG